jgi:hypothetical protein
MVMGIRGATSGMDTWSKETASISVSVNTLGRKARVAGLEGLGRFP